MLVSVTGLVPGLEIGMDIHYGYRSFQEVKPPPNIEVFQACIHQESSATASQSLMDVCPGMGGVKIAQQT